MVDFYAVENHRKRGLNKMYPTSTQLVRILGFLHAATIFVPQYKKLITYKSY